MSAKNVLILLASILISLPVLAQQSTTPVYSNNSNTASQQRMSHMIKMDEEGDLIYDHYGLFGFKMATDGYGIFYEHGKFLTNRKSRFLEFELNEIKDPKDHKVAVSGDGYSYNYVAVGRLNNFYEFKASYGQQVLIGGKGNRNGVAVTYLYSGGISVGMLKQYVLDAYSAQSAPATFKSTYPTIFDSSYAVYDALGLSGGWNHLTFSPGLNAKLAMRFDYGRFNQTIGAFETGVTAEYYLNQMPLMAYVPPSHLFFNAYIAIMFGKRK
jgi:hypothetical protein